MSGSAQRSLLQQLSEAMPPPSLSTLQKHAGMQTCEGNRCPGKDSELSYAHAIIANARKLDLKDPTVPCSLELRRSDVHVPRPGTRCHELRQRLSGAGLALKGMQPAGLRFDQRRSREASDCAGSGQRSR